MASCCKHASICCVLPGPSIIDVGPSISHSVRREAKQNEHRSKDHLSTLENKIRDIENEYRAFCGRKASLGLAEFSETSSEVLKHGFMERHLTLMSQAAGLGRVGSLHQEDSSPFLRRAARKFVLLVYRGMRRLGFLQQENFNDLTVVLANTVLLQDRRIEKLEAQLSARYPNQN